MESTGRDTIGKELMRGDTSFKAIIKGIVTFPLEVKRLNYNLQAMQPKFDNLNEILADFRTMAAPVLGWKVKNEE